MKFSFRTGFLGEAVRPPSARGTQGSDVVGRDHDDMPELDLYFMKADSIDVVPHNNDPVVISVVMVGRKVHRILINQESSTDVLFWSTFVNLWLSSYQLRLNDECLVGFAGDQVEVRGYIDLRMTF